jgi:hypothetical protein
MSLGVEYSFEECLYCFWIDDRAVDGGLDLRIVPWGGIEDQDQRCIAEKRNPLHPRSSYLPVSF